MMRQFVLCLRLLALALLLAGASAARADTPLALWKSFDGRVNFTGTQVSLRAYSNASAPCTVYAPTTNRTASLSIPYGATVLSAQLYWAGSGASDYTVTFENQDITATRKFSSATVGNGFDYFGGAADVTAIVKAKGSGTYNFSGLTVANGAPWCGSQGVLGGFSLLLVYSLASEPERVLNLYEGFSYVQNGEVVVDASNFRWNRTATAVQEKARVGHITWEGDPTLAQGGETLSFEGTEMTDALNPSGNQFNSSSNINNDSASYGIDFDAYDTSVTIWAGYDAAVTTTYRAGQDMVILNAEVLVVPTMPVSDLSISIVRAGALKVGADVQYKVTVTNNGPYTESGAITVTNTLPSGMYYTSGILNGWSCSATTTSGTCTYRGGLAPGASAPVLTVYTRVTTTGEKNNMVKVKGTAIDDNQANNTATDYGTATNADGSTTTPTVLPAYRFTDSVCKANIAIGAAGQTCKAYSAATQGGKAATIYLTAVNDSGVPTVANDKKETIASMQFWVVCNNPTRGSVGASYAGAAIPACAAEGAAPALSSAVNVTFATGAVSVAQSFLYNDIGKITLGLKESKGVASTEVFVSAPTQLAFKRISYAGSDNPWAKTGAGFAPAGALLDIEIGALLSDKQSFAPNFGNELPQPRVSLKRSKIANVEILDEGELIESNKFTWANGSVATRAGWSEVGAINLTTDLSDPDASGNAAYDKLYFGVSVLGSTNAVGRFYPAYFKTEATGAFDCPKSRPASATCTRDSLGAAYSGQAFEVKVAAYNAVNARVKNFGGSWYSGVTLSAVGATVNTTPGAALATNLTVPASATSLTIASATELKDANGITTGYEIASRPSYKLGNPYDDKDPRATNVGDPRAVYLRATGSEPSLTGSAQISSVRSGVGLTEAGVLILNGRLKLPNELGSDNLPTPLTVRAEYWAGATYGWLSNPGFADAVGGPVTAITDLVCSANFLDKSETCGGVITTLGAKNVVMANGVGLLRLRAPGKRPGGASRSGWVTLRYGGWSWLPSTKGRISFGSARSPVIYVREMYF